jgi:hypothetical protein
LDFIDAKKLHSIKMKMFGMTLKQQWDYEKCYHFYVILHKAKMIVMEVPPFPILILKIHYVTSASYIANNIIFQKIFNSGRVYYLLISSLIDPFVLCNIELSLLMVELIVVFCTYVWHELHLRSEG